MAWAISAAVVIAGSTLYTSKKQRDAQKKAKKDAEKQALEDEKQARKAEVFAETEGEGVGNLGRVSLEVDDELDEDEEVSSGNVRI